MTDDVRFALRQLRKNPGFAAIAVVTLGLGIGAAAAIFALVQGVLLSPPPYADPGRLVLVTPARLDGGTYNRGATIGQWNAWRQAQAIEPPAVYRWTFNFLILPDGSRSMGGMVVSPDYFKVLGIRPMLGREFTDAELSRPNVPPTAIIIGHDLWQRQFHGDPGIIGQTLRMSRMPAPLPIVGVMPPGIRFLPDPAAAAEPNYDINAPVDFWFGTAPDQTRLTSGAGNVIARLRDGATIDQAQTEIAAIAAGVAQSEPALQGITARVAGVQDVLNRDGRRLLIPLFGSVAIVFLIACANVAGLLLTRGLQRHAEYAMRSALGAGRWRLFRQTLTESLVLAVTGGAPRCRIRRRHRAAAQGHRRAGGAARRCRAHRLAHPCLRSRRRRHRGGDCRPASRGPRLAPRSPAGAERARARRPAAASAARSAPSPRCRSC